MLILTCWIGRNCGESSRGAECLQAHGAVRDAAGGEVAGFENNIARGDDGRGSSTGQCKK